MDAFRVRIIQNRERDNLKVFLLFTSFSESKCSENGVTSVSSFLKTFALSIKVITFFSYETDALVLLCGWFFVG